MKTLLTIVITLACVAITDASNMLYNITFSQFAIGHEYTNATGGPLDFTSFNRGSDVAIVESNFFGLTNQPLVSTTTNYGPGPSKYILSAEDFNKHLLTLSMDLALESIPEAANGPRATIGFYSDIGPALERTSVEVLFGWSHTNGGWGPSDHLEVTAYEGPTYLPTLIFATNSTFTRDEPMNLVVSIDTYSCLFNVNFNGTTLASVAPFSSSQPIVEAAITLGGYVPPFGAVGIDNIQLWSSPLPYFFAVESIGSEIFLGITNLSHESMTSLLYSPSLISPTWSTAATFQASSSSTNWSGTQTESRSFFKVKSEP